ncbi:MAG: serine/threonine-protein phosphatase [Clostridia bacterium]|nr:serine/threonine-protein phosphatase [Clostridia bacterium]
MPALYKIEYCCINIKGGVRASNQDNFYVQAQYRTQENENDILLTGQILSSANALVAVYDGMGGEACGDIASYIAASETALFDGKSADAPVLLTELCSFINEKICEYARNEKISLMGTTAAIIRFGTEDIAICNLGDSRIFRLRSGEIKQISSDHVLEGSPCEKPPLTQFLGIPEEEMQLEPFISMGDYLEGDRFLLCSDGLTDMLSEDDICEIAAKEKTTEDAASSLVSNALKRGGEDNITVLLCEIQSVSPKKRKKIYNKN